jgi:hypothetical protein
MMLRRLYGISFILVLLAACQPTQPLNVPPTAIPFPTMTPGRLIDGVLPTVMGLALDGSGLANPATAVALASRPTPTPNYGACPAAGSPSLPAMPTTGRAITEEITNFLSDGGTAPSLTDGLRSWGLLGDQGVVRNDVDFTGGGVADVVLAYSAPDDGGTLLILGCMNGLYAPLYQSITGGDTPQIIVAGDINFDHIPDLLFSNRQCSADNSDDCSYRTQLISWTPQGGRFISLLNGPLSSAEPPAINDVDNDQVAEVVVRLSDPGNSATGPLRTGVNIYDWNGASYVLSIVQLDPPRFKIQVIQEADRAFARLDTTQAISLYQQSQTNKDLRFWLNDEPAILDAYVYYRLVVMYAYTEDNDLLPTYQAAIASAPDPATQPVYIAMIDAFWNALQVTHNLHSACVEVQAIITARPEAVGLLNRYGSRSPVYNAADLCPF